MNTKIFTMNQGDAFLFIHDNFSYTYETIAGELADIAAEIADIAPESADDKRDIDTSTVHRMAHQKRKSYKLFGKNAQKTADMMFAAFIAEPLSIMSQEEKADKFSHAKDWLRSHNRTFRGMDSSNEFEDWLKRMLRFSVMNWNTCYAPESRKNSKKSAAKLLAQKFARARIIIDGLELNFADFVAANSELIAAAGITFA